MAPGPSLAVQLRGTRPAALLSPKVDACEGRYPHAFRLGIFSAVEAYNCLVYLGLA